MPSRDELADLVSAPTRYVRSDDPVLRRMAITALSSSEALAAFTDLERLAVDDDPTIRAAVAEKLGLCGPVAVRVLAERQDDADERVREATATAYGEIGDAGAIDWLVEAAGSDPDRAVREAAVAALGAIGDDRAVDPLLALMKDGPPQVRRRSIAAITVFDDERIEPAIRRAALDRNPGVREAAEMVVGRQIRDV